MPCGAKETDGACRPPHPQEPPLYRLVDRFYPEFQAVREERYGPWGPIIGTIVRTFLACGDLKNGFTRI